MNNDKILYSYTRAQAVADGLQIEVTPTAKDAGIVYPVFLTRAVYESYVVIPPGVEGQDGLGRLWDILWMLRFAIRRAKPGHDPLPFVLYVRNDNLGPKLVKLVAHCGSLDLNDTQPAITVMMPDED